MKSVFTVRGQNLYAACLFFLENLFTNNVHVCVTAFSEGM